MGTSKLIKVEFYQVEGDDPASPPDFRGILEQTFDKKGRSRTWTHNGTPVRLKTLHSNDGVLEGDMLRIRMDDLPTRARTTGDEKPLDLDPDEGLGNNTAFLYHPRMRVLALQRNSTGATRSTFANYFSEMSAQCISLVPVISGEALQRLCKRRVFRKIRIRIARLGNTSYLQEAGLDHDEALSVLEKLKGQSLDVTVSMGHLTGSLERESVVDIAKRLLALRSKARGAVQTLDVYGKDNDDERANWIDMLEFCVQEERMIELPKTRSRSIAYALRLGAVREAWKARKAEIEKILQE